MPDQPEGYTARKVVERMTGEKLGMDNELSGLNAAHISMEAARRVLYYLPADHTFGELKIPNRILEQESDPFVRSEFSLSTFQFGEAILDAAAYRLAEQLANYHTCTKLDSPKDAIMAARTVDQKRGLIITVSVIPALVHPYLKAVLLAGVA